MKISFVLLLFISLSFAKGTWFTVFRNGQNQYSVATTKEENGVAYAYYDDSIEEVISNIKFEI